MFRSPAGVPDGGLLGAMHSGRPGAHHFVERISTRGWATLHLHAAGVLIDSGQASVNLVAAIPSLHAALSAMVAMFLWRRIHRYWRPLLMAYALTMAFALVYSAEHYVIDILLGWVLAAVVLLVAGRLESRRRCRMVDTGSLHRAATPLASAAGVPCCAVKSTGTADIIEPARDLGGGLPVKRPVDPVGDIAEVWSGDYVVQAAQRVPGGQWLDIEHIQTGCGEPV